MDKTHIVSPGVAAKIPGGTQHFLWFLWEGTAPPRGRIQRFKLRAIGNLQGVEHTRKLMPEHAYYRIEADRLVAAEVCVLEDENAVTMLLMGE